ncbi:MAG: hypothetical protein H6728_15650 [Myxococcales bacterium]|nr:hypothetical protein [Myxococcales bacterium]
MKEDLDDKARNLLRAQRLYLQTIKLRHAEWALAAVYQIGKMYEEMYEAMMKAPIPTELNKEEKAIYVQELRKRLRSCWTKHSSPTSATSNLPNASAWTKRTGNNEPTSVSNNSCCFTPALLDSLPSCKKHSPKTKSTAPKPTSRPASQAATSQPKK